MSKPNKDPKKLSKNEKAEIRKEAAKKKKLIKRVTWIASGVIVLGVIFAAASLYNPELPGEKVKAMKEQNHIPSLDAQHTPYNSDPPTSGPHAENMANWGVYKEPVAKELLVHNLEDGGIVIYYNKQADDQTIAKLESFATKYSKQLVIVPYPEMKNQITSTAWERMDRLDQFDEKRIVDFIERYKGIDHH